MNKVLFSSNRMDWETPKEFFKLYDDIYRFTLDVCCLKATAKCDRFFTPKENGLEQDWSKDICWMNPPYGREIGIWVKKAYSESLQGATVVCLLPARTDTRWWWDYCMKGEIQFIKGRLKFRGKNKDGIYVNNNATFPSAIVIFKPKSILTIQDTLLKRLASKSPVSRFTLRSYLNSRGFVISDREMRRTITGMRKKDGHLIASSKSGYKLATTRKEFDAHIKFKKVVRFIYIEGVSTDGQKL